MLLLLLAAGCSSSIPLSNCPAGPPAESACSPSGTACDYPANASMTHCTCAGTWQCVQRPLAGDSGAPTDGASVSDGGSTDAGGCGPDSCGACPPGCMPTDTCTGGQWSCGCACESSGLGAACASPNACGAGLTCYGDAPAGYCLPGSAGSPQSCTSDASCPTGSYCSPIPNHQISGVCMLGCSGPGGCRAGYACDTVYLFPTDTTSPHSSHPVCWVHVCDASQECNLDPNISSLHGTCQPDHTCTCTPPSTKDAQTGKCT